MKTRIILSLLFTVLFFGCKKDVEPGIDYNVVTEQRILEISEQATIKDEDIATLERLLANVTDNSLKPKYTEMIAGVRVLKDFIPAFNQLRIDPDLNFQEHYAKLKEQIKLVTDKLPRKAKLQTELETALANYNTEEVEFLASILDPTKGDLARYLADNFSIQPVVGKPNRYLRADIERVDSLSFFFQAAWVDKGILPQVLRHFRGLKYLKTGSDLENVIDLNHLSNLETLILAINDKQPEGWELKMDKLTKLKHFEIPPTPTNRGKSPFGEVLDFTDKFPLLETLILSQEVTNKLTTFLLPNKQQFSKLGLFGGFHKIKRLVIEGKNLNFPYGGNIQLGKLGSPIEVDEIKLSGIGDESKSLWIVGPGEVGNVKIKKLSLSGIKGELAITWLDIEQLNSSEITDVNSFILNDLRFSQKPDFSVFKFPKAFQIDFQNNTYGNGAKFTWEDAGMIFTGKPNPETMKTIYLNGVTNPPTKAYMKGLFPNLENYND